VIPACPVCGTVRSSYFATDHDRLFGLVPGEFTLYRCGACRCLFQSPLPADEQLAGFYPDDYWWSGESPQRGLARQIQRLERTYRDFVIRDHTRFLLRCTRETPAGRGTLLDIGCGSGSFLSSAARVGFTCFGMDRSAHAVAAAAGRGIEVRQGDIGSETWGDRRFDFISLFHVLEHLTDPRHALLYAKELLQPGGSLIIQVPNVDSVQARVFGGRWYGLDVPRHLINFSPAALEHILVESGFQIVARAKFSLRDNPASIASSLFPSLDPIGRRGRSRRSGPALSAILEFLYLGLFLVSVPPAFLESLAGRGGTVWVSAKRRSG
jgi:2-polyprenyl-3-methyl-5-hydroxy-6-metoxy-1,4-benzoquinol methylase